MWILTLLVLILCTCNGPRLMLGSQSFENQIDYSIYSGRLAKQTKEVMVCAISRTGVRDFHSWRQGRLLTWQPYQAIHGLGFCPNLAPMRRKCSQIKLYPLVLTIPFSLNQYKTVWTGRRRNLPIVSPPRSSPGGSSTATKLKKSYQVLTPRLTGKIPVTTRTMGRNSNYSSTTNQVNGKDQTTSLTTGGLQKRH